MADALVGKVAVVTGASRGIGRAVALELASLGAAVVVTARTDAPRTDIAGTIGETVSMITDRGRSAVAVRADLLAPGGVDLLVREVIGSFGRVDILVNNAAYIGEAVFESFWEMTPESWRSMIELNVNVPWVLAKALAPAMRDQGGGLIVNMSSGVAHSPDPAVPGPLPRAGGLGAAYPTSKAALHQMNATVGNELRAAGITMVAVDPGFARSESAEILAARLGADPAWAQPVEVAAAAIGLIATHPDPLGVFACRSVVAAELVRADGDG